jgi:hypothetical protein
MNHPPFPAGSIGPLWHAPDFLPGQPDRRIPIVQRSADTSRFDIITFPPPLRRSSSDSTGTAAPHDRWRPGNTASEERFKESTLAGPETQLDEPGHRSPRKRINAILAAASLLAGFALLAALFEPDATGFVGLSGTADPLWVFLSSAPWTKAAALRKHAPQKPFRRSEEDGHAHA